MIVIVGVVGADGGGDGGGGELSGGLGGTSDGLADADLKCAALSILQ